MVKHLTKVYNATKTETKLSKLEKSVKLLTKQRNDLSKLCNQISKKAAILSCEKEKLTKPPPKYTHVSVTGNAFFILHLHSNQYTLITYYAPLTLSRIEVMYGAV